MMQILCYHLILLANLMETPLREYKIGWSIIVCICILFVVNMGYMVSLTLTDLLRKCYLTKLLKQAEERRKQIEAAKT